MNPRHVLGLQWILALGMISFATPHAKAQELIHSLVSPHPNLNGNFGFSVAKGGDVDGDGVDDLLVGAPSENVDGALRAGRAYVFSGATGLLLRALEGFTPEASAQFGRSLADAGDYSGDGLDDVFVGAPAQNGIDLDVGWVYRFSATGASGGTSAAPTADGQFGAAIVMIGDVNNDGVRDHAAGAPGENFVGGGRVYVRDGDDGGVIHTLESPNGEAFGAFGSVLAGPGDVNGDGVPDVVVGAPEETVGGLLVAGRVYVFSGATGDLIRTLTSPNSEGNGAFGLALSSVGDLNGDTIAEIVVGSLDSPGASPSLAGRVYVFSGGSGALLFTLRSPSETASGVFGVSVSGVGDSSGDGISDLLVGASGEPSFGGAAVAGRAYAFSGADGSLLQSFESPNVDVTGRFGAAVASAGDTNGDGLADFLIGARDENAAELADAGRAYVFAGVDVTAPVLTVGVAPASLWPANSTYYAFDLASLQITASDSDPSVSAEDVVLTRVTSDEPEDMPGSRDGATSRDITITFDCRSSSVRAERDGKHNGRVYTMHLAVADAAGNVGTATYRVAAPIRRDGAAIRDLDAYTVTGCDPITGAPALVAGTSHGEAGPGLEFDLEPNVPNPFENRTQIAFTVPEAVNVRITVFDVLGRELARLADGAVEAGRHTVLFETGTLPAGTYLYRLEAGSFVATRRMMIAR